MNRNGKRNKQNIQRNKLTNINNNRSSLGIEPMMTEKKTEKKLERKSVTIISSANKNKKIN